MYENDDIKMMNRQNDVWLRRDKDTKYAVILMFKSTDSELKWITKGPMEGETAIRTVDEMLNALEHNQYVCLNSQFVNPANVVMVKLDLWKEKSDRDYGTRSYYE